MLSLFPAEDARIPIARWLHFVGSALDALKTDRARWWTLKEISAVVKEKTAAPPTGKGWHMDLYGRLLFIGAVESNESVNVRASRFIDRIAYGRDAIVQLAPPAPAPVAALPPVAPAPTPPNELDQVEEELTLLGAMLPDLSPEQRAGHLALWAGQVRSYAETISVGSDGDPQWSRTRQVLQRVQELAGTTFVAAADIEWNFEDWRLYIAANQLLARGLAPAELTKSLTREQTILLHEGNLRALIAYMKDHKRFDRDEAERVLRESSDVGSDNLSFNRAVKALASTKVVTKVAKHYDVPAQITAVTKGMRVLVAGGQGERDAHRQSMIEAFEFASVEWVCAEKEKARPFQKLGTRLKSFDVVFLLAGYTGHAAANALIALCKKAKATVVMIPNGYSVASFADAIEKQFLSYRAPAAPKTGHKRRAVAR